MVWLWLAVALMLVCLVAFSKCQVFFRFHMDGARIHITLNAYLLDGFIPLRYSLSYDPARKKRLQFKLPFKVGQRKKQQSPKMSSAQKRAARLFVKKIKLDWLLHMRLGLNDAAQTAVLSGFLGALLHALAAAINGYVAGQTQSIRVSPVFSQETLQVRFRCMITIRTGHIIVVAARFALIKISEAMRAWNISKRLCAQPWKT